MIVGVSGSRDWADPGAIRRGLAAAQGDTPPRDMTLHHGQCPPRTERGDVIGWGKARLMPLRQKLRLQGADWLAYVIAFDMGWRIRGYPAQWAAKGAGAGFARNSDMVNDGADVWLAFINACTAPGRECAREPHGSHGSADCLAKVRKARIPVVVTRRGW